MSLIIEDKNALDSLANAIIGANGSVDKTSATKGELTDIINGIIPLKSKFASGVFTPSENITTQNSPRINFALGNDENGIPVKPNVVIFYQPYGLTEEKLMNASIFSLYVNGFPLTNPIDYPDAVCWNACYHRRTQKTSSGLYVGYFQRTEGINNNTPLFNDVGFILSPIDGTYPFLASHPIVWLQIKF